MLRSVKSPCHAA